MPPYQVVCVDVTDTQLQAAQLLGAEGAPPKSAGRGSPLCGPRW
ncbi:hypothetical protein ACGFX2_35145 [Streptomyces goshikiensis]